MIPGNKQLMLVGQVVEPATEATDFCGIVPGVHEVSGMDQYVSLRDFKAIVEPMGITHCHYPHILSGLYRTLYLQVVAIQIGIAAILSCALKALLRITHGQTHHASPSMIRTTM